MAALSKTRDIQISFSACVLVCATPQFSLVSSKRVKDEVCHIYWFGKSGRVVQEGDQHYLTSLPNSRVFSRRGGSHFCPRGMIEVHVRVSHNLRLLYGLPILSLKIRQSSADHSVRSPEYFTSSVQFRPRRHVCFCVSTLEKSASSIITPIYAIVSLRSIPVLSQ